MRHLSKNRGAGCPKRWRMEHTSHYQTPIRPPACPCLWSPSLINAHFKTLLSNDPELSLTLSHLMTFWAD